MPGFISYPPQTATNAAPVTLKRPLTVGGGGLKVLSPDDSNGSNHLIVEAPWAPIATGLIDLSDTDEQVIEVTAQGHYIADKLVVWASTGAPGNATLTVKTLDAARGGGRTIATALALSALSDRKALAEADVALSAILSAPHIYCTVASPGTGTVRVQLFGRIAALEDPDSRTYL